MLSITKTLALVGLTFSSLSLASPVDPATHTLVKRGDWVPGKSSCPSGDGAEYDGPNGGAWRISCGKDTQNTSVWKTTSASSFTNCIQQCGSYPDQCHRVVYTADVNSPGTCYLKQDRAGDLAPVDGHKVATKLNG